MESRNLAIGILSVTASILFVGLFLIHSFPRPAFASGMSVQGGDYVVATGSLRETEEMIFVMDAAAEVVISYRFNPKTQVLEINQPGIDLNTMREMLSASQEKDARKKK